MVTVCIKYLSYHFDRNYHYTVTMETKEINLSVALAVINEEKNIDACLSAIKDIADEIIIIDGGSTDCTIEIAKKYTEKIISTNNPPMFHINKQKALEACTGKWILQLDADEIITDGLKNEIKKTINSGTPSINGYYISRRNYFWGHFMKKGGQYPDAVIRLVRRGKAKFPCKSVHEQIAVEGDSGSLQEPMLHYSYRTRADYWKKADTYTSLTANESFKQKNSAVNNFISYFVIKPIVTFLSIYIRHKGFVDGVTGLEFALYSAMHFQIAYSKSIQLK